MDLLEQEMITLIQGYGVPSEWTWGQKCPPRYGKIIKFTGNQWNTSFDWCDLDKLSLEYKKMLISDLRELQK